VQGSTQNNVDKIGRMAGHEQGTHFVYVPIEWLGIDWLGDVVNCNQT
jgi:hypothetical protein